jgi:protein involved in polysaccharide export with SLBB domain
MTLFRRLVLIRALCIFSALASQLFVTGPVRAEETNVSKLSGATGVAENRIGSLVSAYKLAAGDVITIRVFGEDDFTKEKIRLTDAGTVSFPALGEIKVLGLTIGDLERIVVNGLRGRILVNPRVSVQIEEYRPFYVNGMVEKPGGYPYQPGLTVRKAASLAGGFRERASLSKIYLIREDDPAQRPQKVELNTPVGPGDILTVEESFF